MQKTRGFCDDRDGIGVAMLLIWVRSSCVEQSPSSPSRKTSLWPETDGGNADVGSINFHASMCIIDQWAHIFGHQNLPNQKPCGSLHYGSGTVDSVSLDMAFSVTRREIDIPPMTYPSFLPSPGANHVGGRRSLMRTCIVSNRMFPRFNRSRNPAWPVTAGSNAAQDRLAHLGCQNRAKRGIYPVPNRWKE
jgi:hypothetical protein